MLERISYKEFANSGLFQAMNTFLHMFGHAIVYDTEADIFYPARCHFRGFSEKDNDKMYNKLQATFLKQEWHD